MSFYCSALSVFVMTGCFSQASGSRLCFLSFIDVWTCKQIEGCKIYLLSVVNTGWHSQCDCTVYSILDLMAAGCTFQNCDHAPEYHIALVGSLSFVMPSMPLTHCMSFWDLKVGQRSSTHMPVEAEHFKYNMHVVHPRVETEPLYPFQVRSQSAHSRSN